MPLLSIIVPTYNERENIQPLFEAIGRAVGDFELIFVDDASPDGTAEAISRLCQDDHRVKLIERETKLGLGSAVLCGLEVASGDYVAMMDADLSHNPADLPRLMAALKEADVAVGSRYVNGASAQSWSWRRQLTSRGAILLARLLLPIKVHDATSGFALFRRPALEGVKGQLSPRGFKLLLEILVKAPHLQVKEVPVTFVERRRGRSKMDMSEVRAYLALCWQLRKFTKHKESSA